MASVATGDGTARANAPLRVPLVFPIAARAMNTIDRARAYLAKLPPAIAGSGGHAATFKAACVAVEFGLNESAAWKLLCEWNVTHCQPHWTDSELRHKLADARRATTPKEQFNQPPKSPGLSQKDNASARWKNPRVTAADAQTKCATADFSASFVDQSPAERQFSALASLRGISIEGVQARLRTRLAPFRPASGARGLVHLGRFTPRRTGATDGRQAVDGEREGVDVARLASGLAGRRRGVRAIYGRRLLRGKPGLARGSSFHLDGKPRT